MWREPHAICETGFPASASTQQGVEPGASISLEILRREAAAGLRCPVCRSQVIPPGGDTLHGVSINKGLKEMADEYRQLSRAMGRRGHWG